jgi:dipeptidyl aminopeptidase/acylaminoacyl peptidase
MTAMTAAGGTPRAKETSMGGKLTPEALVYDLTQASDPRVSPDGTRIVFSQVKTDRDSKKTSAQVWVCGIDGSAPRRLTWSGNQNGGARWSDDGTHIAFVSDRVEKSGLFILPMDGGEARELARHAQPLGSLAWSPDGSRIAYTTTHDPANPNEAAPAKGAAPPVRVTSRIDYKQDNRGYLGDKRSQVWVVDVASGGRRMATREAVDHNNPQWSPDGKRLAVQVTTKNGMCSRLALVPVDGDDPVLVGGEDGVIAVWAWSPDGGRVLYAGDERQTWQSDFFLYDVASGETRRLTDDLHCLPDGGFPTVLPPSQPVWLDANVAMFHAVHAGKSGVYTIDTRDGAVALLHEWQALNAGFSADAAGRYVVQGHNSLERAGEITVFDRESGKAEIVTHYSDGLLQHAPAAEWEQFVVHRDGFAIDAWLLKPADFDPAKQYPVILDVHGGPNGHYGYGFNAVQQLLASNGFLVVFSNPRGSTSYGREFTLQVSRDWGGEDYQDLMTVVDTVLERPYADPRRTGIWGYSYGGYMTAWTIARNHRFQAAVCGAPCFDLESMYGTSDISHTFGELQWGGPPHADREWYATHSPSNFAHNTCTPTLIIHGEADDRCPIGQGEQMFVALKKAGCEVEFARYPGGSHLFLRVGPAEHREDVLRRVLGWFSGHLS